MPVIFYNKNQIGIPKTSKFATSVSAWSDYAMEIYAKTRNKEAMRERITLVNHPTKPINQRDTVKQPAQGAQALTSK